MLEPHLVVAELSFGFTGPERFGDAAGALKGDPRREGDRLRLSAASRRTRIVLGALDRSSYSTDHRPGDQTDDTTLHPSRRTFLRGALAGGRPSAWGLAGLGRRDLAGKPAAGKIGDFKISLAEWSLHKALFAKKQIDNLDFPKIAREQYGIDGVEFVNQFFKDKAHDSAYLKDLKTRANDHGVTCVLIMIDGEGDLSAKDKASADKAVENHKKWVDAAAALGCHSIRVNTGEQLQPDRRRRRRRGVLRRSPSTARSTRSTSSARTTAGRRATPTPCSP